jgi:hypothetical protein
MFSSIPYENLLKTILLERTRAFSPLGRLGYPLEPLLRGLLAAYYIPLRSTAQVVRRLQDDPVLAMTCGFVPGHVPHRKAFSRFQKKLRKYQHMVDECLNQVTTELGSWLPGFGSVVVVDSTPVRSHSNGNKEPASDSEAGWVYKEGDEKKKFGGFDRVNTHTTLSILVMQAVALAKAKAGQMDEIRVCVRQVG